MKLLGLFLYKPTQFLRFNSSINLSFIGSTLNEQSTYIKCLNCSWSTKLYHSMAALFEFLFIYSNRISSLVFVIYGGDSCFFNEYVHPFTSSCVLSTRLLLIHLLIPISSSSLLLSFVYSFTVSKWLFLLHLNILISSSTHFFPFASWFLFSTFFFIRAVRIPIYSFSLLLAFIHRGLSSLKF